MNIFSSGINWVKKVFGIDDGKESMKFEVGAGLNPEQTKTAEDVIKKQPIAQRQKQPMKFEVGAGLNPEQTKTARETLVKPQTIKFEEPFVEGALRDIPRRLIGIGKEITGSKTSYQAPIGSFQESLVGTKPVPRLREQGRQFLEETTGATVKGNITPMIAGLSLAVLDLVPGGKSTKVAEKIAASKNADEIVGLLKPFLKKGGEDGGGSGAIKQIANILVDVDKPEDVVKILDNNIVDGLRLSDVSPRNLNINPFPITQEEKGQMLEFYELARPDIEKAIGHPVGKEELIGLMEESNVISEMSTREDTAKKMAEILNTKYQIITKQQEIFAGGDNIVKGDALKEYLQLLKNYRTSAGEQGRLLRTFGFDGEKKTYANNILGKILEKTDKIDEVTEAAKDVDFTNTKQVNEFYRKFVKPTWKEILDEYRYNNMLSNPRTHLRNIYTNAIQGGVLQPATDFVTNLLSFKPIQATKEFGSYYKGFAQSFGDATAGAIKAMFGNAPIEHLDAGHIPTGKLPGIMQIPTRALEAADVFFKKLISGAEKSRLMTSGLPEKEALKQAEEYSTRAIFRSDFKEKGQGIILNTLDKGASIATAAVNKLPGGRWMVPFIRTPYNIAKQSFQYSPLGLVTIPGAKNKKEQLAKTLIGSAISVWGANKALNGETTWLPPVDKEQKELFFASGKKPMSVKIGNQWVPMYYLGILGLATAIPASIKEQYEKNPQRFEDKEVLNISVGVAQRLGEYVSSQTFLENIGNWVDLMRGDQETNVGKNVAFTSGQMIPLNGFLRYVSTITDPVFRKSDGFSTEIQKRIPYLSNFLEPYTLPTGEVSKRETKNYFLPWDVGTPNEQFTRMLDVRNEELKLQQKLNSSDKVIREKAIQIATKLQNAKTEEEIIKAVEELKGNKPLRDELKLILKKQANYAKALVEPYRLFEPKDIAAKILNDAGSADTQEKMNELQEFITALKESGIWDSKKVKNALNEIIKQRQAAEQIKTNN